MSENENDRKPVAGPTPPLSKAKKQTNRRRFLRTTLLTGGVLGAALSGFLPIIYSQKKRLRPPGALDEKDFLGSCIKCGQCVQVCPVQAIKLADLIDGMGVGTPYIDPRSQACDFSCDAVQCILACPTGALTYDKPDFMEPRSGMPLAHAPILKAKENDPEPSLNLKERFGVARLDKPDACLAVQGKGFKGVARGAAFTGTMRYIDVDRWNPIPVREHPYEREVCDLCVTECPIKDAIALRPFGPGRFIPVVQEQCVGCGVCEMICPVEPTAIVVDAQATWKGEA